MPHREGHYVPSVQIPHSQSGQKPGRKPKLTDAVYIREGVCGDPPVCEVSQCRGLGCWYMMLIRITTRSVRLTGSETGYDK